MPGTQGRGDRGVTAGRLTVLTDPLHGNLALFRSEAQLVEVQSLPGSNERRAAPDDPTFQQPGAHGAEPALSVEGQDR
jgi:hypothetical protein